ncbi:MAG: response regulator transcription factor [Candidatus Obscuribacterales bacterium]|nr:response regulator transcription factor [Candidatus Obscuribacterales bacterium]
MSRLLIGETQQDLATAMEDFFSMQHYTVQVESNGMRILECLREQQYDLIILETALPGVDGIGIVRDFRSNRGDTPILLISNQRGSKELQLGLDAGADCYVVKPFELGDLAARMRAMLRRPLLRAETVIVSGDIELDTEARTVTKNDELLHLHPMEYKLLQFLLSHPNQVFSAHALFERVWNKDSSQREDTVRTHIRTLRQKVDTDLSQSIITTVRGFGYKSELQ